MATERLITGTISTVPSYLHMLIFGCTLVVYNLHHVVRKLPASFSGTAAITNDNWLAYALALTGGLIIALTGLLHSPWVVIVVCGCAGLFSLSYTLPLLPLKTRKRLRDYGLLKIIVLTTVWVVVTTVLPMLQFGVNPARYPFEIGLRFALIFALCILFDLRDVSHDAANNIHTLPYTIGERNSYLLIYLSIIFFALLSVGQNMRYHHGQRLIDALITAVATLVVALYLKKNTTQLACLVLADGMMLLYSLLLIF